MCSIVISLLPGAEFPLLVAANRDEMMDRPWDPPGRYWREAAIIGGRDRLAGGSWLAVNDQGVMAALLNRSGSLGPEAGRRSRGELPILALAASDARAACARIMALDAGDYRSFNMVIADQDGGFLLRGLAAGAPEVSPLAPGVTMVTAREPNDPGCPRIARYRAQFEQEVRPTPEAGLAGWAAWARLLADDTAPDDSAIRVKPHHGFGTVCSSLIALGRERPQFLFGEVPLSYYDVYGTK